MYATITVIMYAVTLLIVDRKSFGYLKVTFVFVFFLLEERFKFGLNLVFFMVGYKKNKKLLISVFLAVLLIALAYYGSCDKGFSFGIDGNIAGEAFSIDTSVIAESVQEAIEIDVGQSQQEEISKEQFIRENIKEKLDSEGVDSDGDGTRDSEDCEPEDATVYPGAEEICADSVDNNCDGSVDEDGCVVDLSVADSAESCSSVGGKWLAFESDEGYSDYSFHSSYTYADDEFEDIIDLDKGCYEADDSDLPTEVTCGDTIDSSGNYFVYESCEGNGISIITSSVNLYCSEGVVISGDGSGYGIIVNDNWANVLDGVQVVGCTVTGFERGIFAEYFQDSYFLYNTITGNSEYGVYLSKGGYESEDVTVIGRNYFDYNDVSENEADGILLVNSDDIEIKSNLINDNGEPTSDSDAGDDGIVVRSSESVTIQGNEINSNGNDGIYLETSESIKIKDNSICDNYRGYDLKCGTDSTLSYYSGNTVRSDEIYECSEDWPSTGSNSECS